MLAASVDEPLSAELTAAVCARSEGNPFFAGELAAAAARGEHELPPALHDLLIADRRAAGRRHAVAAAGRRRRRPRCPQRAPHGCHGAARERGRGRAAPGGRAPRAGGRPVARAASASAMRSSPRPSTRRCCPASARSCTRASPPPSPATPRWRQAARSPASWPSTGSRPASRCRRSTASLEAARDAQALSGLDEALRHLEQVLLLWDDVPTAEDLAGLALPAVLAWAEELADHGARGEDEIDARALAGHPRRGRVGPRRERRRAAGRDAGRSRRPPWRCSSARACSRRPATARSARAAGGERGARAVSARRRAREHRRAPVAAARRRARSAAATEPTSACAPPLTTRRRRSSPTTTSTPR